MDFFCQSAILIALSSILVNSQDFGYDGIEGPEHWGEQYKKCIGKHQSPIDIEEDSVKKVRFPKLVFENFDKKIEAVTLFNSGHTVQLSISKGHVPRIHGGPLKSRYKFQQLHFHWGDDDSEGSENTINHNSFPLELHMVFYNEKYRTFENSTQFLDGLLVLSFLYSAMHNNNHNYLLFEDGLAHVEDLHSNYTITDFVSFDKFTTTKRDVYFTYEGSLTTPPCSEVVTWIEFKETIPLSSIQISDFRELKGLEGKLKHNHRPVQPLYDRVIRMNDPKNSQQGLLRNAWPFNVLLSFVLGVTLVVFVIF